MPLEKYHHPRVLELHTVPPNMGNPHTEAHERKTKLWILLWLTRPNIQQMQGFLTAVLEMSKIIDIDQNCTMLNLRAEDQDWMVAGHSRSHQEQGPNGRESRTL